MRHRMDAIRAQGAKCATRPGNPRAPSPARSRRPLSGLPQYPLELGMTVIGRGQGLTALDPARFHRVPTLGNAAAPTRTPHRPSVPWLWTRRTHTSCHATASKPATFNPTQSTATSNHSISSRNCSPARAGMPPQRPPQPPSPPTKAMPPPPLAQHPNSLH